MDSLLAKMERRTKVSTVRVGVMITVRVEVEVESLPAKMGLPGAPPGVYTYVPRYALGMRSGEVRSTFSCTRGTAASACLTVASACSMLLQRERRFKLTHCSCFGFGKE